MQTEQTFLNLAETLKDLEKRLNGISQNNDWHPDNQSVSLAIKHLARQIAKALSQKQSPPDYKLMQVLQNLLQQMDQQKGHRKVAFSLTQLAYLKLLQHIFNQLSQDKYLFPDAYKTLRQFQLAFALCLLEDPLELMDTWHPIRHFFESVLVNLRHIEEHPSSRGKELLEFTQKLLFNAILSDLPLRDAFAKAQQNFQQFTKQFHLQLQQSNKALVQKELSQTHLKDLGKVVRHEIDNLMDGHKLPDFVVSFFQDIWQKHLYMTYLKEGANGRNWRLGLKDIQFIIQLLTIKNPFQVKQMIDKDMEAVKNRFLYFCKEIYSQDEAESFYSKLENHLESVVNSLPPDNSIQWQEVHAERNKQDNLFTQNDALKHLVKGEWYRSNLRGLASNLWLIEKNLEHDYLLFSNYTSELVCRMTCAEAIKHIKNHNLHHMPTTPVFDQLINQALPELDNFSLETSDTIARHEVMHKEKRQIAIEQEIQAKALQKAEDERKQRQAEAEAEKQRAYQQVLDAVESMNLGEALQMTNEDNEKFICTLGMKLKSTRKLVFLDRNGRRVAEFLPEELADSMIKGTATLVDMSSISSDDLDNMKWNPFSRHGKY